MKGKTANVRLVLRFIEYVRAIVLHIPMRDDFVHAHTHTTAQRAFDISGMLRKINFCGFNAIMISLVMYYCMCYKTKDHTDCKFSVFTGNICI